MKAGDLVGGKYRLVRRLGQGAMGVVWEASHTVTQRHVAIKIIANATENLRKRLLREARAAGQIAHRNVVEVLDLGESDDGDSFLVMQLLSGETLYACMKREGTIDRARGLSILRDVAKALVAAHAQGIIHRDLKPANVFLHREAGSQGEVVKVLDFGLCKPMGADEVLTTPGGMLGSPAYMSPEQVMSVTDLDPRTDLWTLGVVMFEVLSGRRPFLGRGPDLIHAVVSDPIPRLRDVARGIDPELDDLVARCLCRERQERIASASEVLAKLEAITAREEQRASRLSQHLAQPMPESPDTDDGELVATLLYKPGQLRVPPEQPRSSPYPMPASQPEPPLSSSGGFPSMRQSAPEPVPPSNAGFHGTVPMPRVTAAQVEQWAAQRAQAQSGSAWPAQPLGVHQGPIPPQPMPMMQPGPMMQQPVPPRPMMQPGPLTSSPALPRVSEKPVAPQQRAWLFLVIAAFFLSLVGVGVFLAFSGSKKSEPSPSPSASSSAKASKSAR